MHVSGVFPALWEPPAERNQEKGVLGAACLLQGLLEADCSGLDILIVRLGLVRLDLVDVGH